MKTVYIIFLIFTALLLNSCDFIQTTTNGSPQNKTVPFNMVEQYYIPPKGFMDNWTTMNLKTIKVWEGSESKVISFNADKTPWILNAGYTPTSKISTKFEINVWQDSKTISGIRQGPMVETTRTGINGVLVEAKGAFTIEIDASGCGWWVKIGVE